MHPRRAALIALATAAGCAEPPLPVQALPAPAAVAARRTAIEVDAPLLIPGERLDWDVSWRGMSVGRLQIAAGSARQRAPSDRRMTIDSEFRTRGLADRAAPVRHRLTTRVALAGAHPVDSVERLSFAGRARRTAVAFRGARARARSRSVRRDRATPDGSDLHTLHTALAVLRAWAATGDRPGFLFVLHEHRLFRIDVAPPRADGSRVRLDCRAIRVAKPPEQVLTFTLWVSDGTARTPVRIEAEHERGRLVAELIERSL